MSRFVDARHPQLHVGAFHTLETDFRCGATKTDHFPGEIVDGDNTAWIADIKRMPDGVGFGERQEHAINDVFDIAPRPYLAAVVVYCQVFSAKSSHDKRVNGPLANLARTVNVKGSDGGSGQLQFFPVVVCQVLGGQLTY